MRLWTKTWYETRLRFTLAIAAMAAVWLVGRATSDDSAKTMFVMFAIVLGGGSLRQERAHGTAGFTLALPVSRTRLVVARVGVGVVEVAAVAAVPIITGSLSVDVAATWAVCGAVVFAAALFVSTLIASEYAAWLACLFGVLAYQATVALTSLKRWPSLDLYRQMSGEGTFIAIVGVAAAAVGFAALADLRQRRSEP